MESSKFEIGSSVYYTSPDSQIHGTVENKRFNEKATWREPAGWVYDIFVGGENAILNFICEGAGEHYMSEADVNNIKIPAIPKRRSYGLA